ncbi:MAG: hypothetical protein DME25_02925 [Verrucomicrobia bacterium]|nr:MAG: hypothetical protein DME25_02925 [Verrucomicrobiota bacterium]
MRFLRQNQYVLCFLGVLVFSCVMVLRQFMANQSAHIQRREDFILLQERAERKACERFYQVLIQELPDLSDRELVEDWQRTSLLLNPKTPNTESLLWKYHISVKNELQGRADRRVERALSQAERR